MTAVVSPTPAGAPFFAPTPLPAAAGMSALALLYAQAAGGQLVGKQAALDLECFALRRVGDVAVSACKHWHRTHSLC